MWRAAAGAFILAFWTISGALEFFRGSAAYLARLSSAPERSIIDWLKQFSLTPTISFSSTKNLLCGWNVGCDPFYALSQSGLPLPVLTGSYWMQFAIIGGGILIWRSEKNPLSRTALGFCDYMVRPSDVLDYQKFWPSSAVTWAASAPPTSSCLSSHYSPS